MDVLANVRMNLGKNLCSLVNSPFIYLLEVEQRPNRRDLSKPAKRYKKGCETHLSQVQSISYETLDLCSCNPPLGGIAAKTCEIGGF